LIFHRLSPFWVIDFLLLVVTPACRGRIADLGSRILLFFRVGLHFACSNQAPQTTVDVGAPYVGTDIETLIFGNQAQVSEADFGLVALLGKLKNNFCALPLALVFRKIKIVVDNKPNDFLVGDYFR
jgi:hypothetical protein